MTFSTLSVTVLAEQSGLLGQYIFHNMHIFSDQPYMPQHRSLFTYVYRRIDAQFTTNEPGGLSIFSHHIIASRPQRHIH